MTAISLFGQPTRSYFESSCWQPGKHNPALPVLCFPRAGSLMLWRSLKSLSCFCREDLTYAEHVCVHQQWKRAPWRSSWSVLWITQTPCTVSVFNINFDVIMSGCKLSRCECSSSLCWLKIKIFHSTSVVNIWTCFKTSYSTSCTFLLSLRSVAASWHTTAPTWPRLLPLTQRFLLLVSASAEKRFCYGVKNVAFFSSLLQFYCVTILQAPFHHCNNFLSCCTFLRLLF